MKRITLALLLFFACAANAQVKLVLDGDTIIKQAFLARLNLSAGGNSDPNGTLIFSPGDYKIYDSEGGTIARWFGGDQQELELISGSIIFVAPDPADPDSEFFSYVPGTLRTQSLSLTNRQELPQIDANPSGAPGSLVYVNGQYYGQTGNHFEVIGPAASAPVQAAIAATQTYSVQRANHTGAQSADTLTDGATNKAFLASERAKLAGIVAGATTASRGIATEVWIAKRTDGIDGDGAKANPRKATSASELDGILSAQPLGAVVHLGPGVYDTTVGRTKGRLLGEGVGITTIRLTSATAGYNSGVLADTDPHEYIEVGNLTVDCNFAGISQSAPHVICGVLATAKRVYLHDIEVINMGSSSGEAFAIIASGLDADSVGVIERCIVRSSSTFSNDASYIGNSGPGTTFISECSIDGTLPTGGYYPNKYGYVAAGSGRTIISDCVAKNVGVAVHCDTSSGSQMIVDDCTFSAVRYRALNIGASVYTLGDYHDYRITNCYFGLAADCQGLYGYREGVKGGLFAANTVVYEAAPTNGSGGWITYPQTSGIIVKDNLFDPRLTFSGAGTGWWGVNNRRSDNGLPFATANNPLDQVSPDPQPDGGLLISYTVGSGGGGAGLIAISSGVYTAQAGDVLEYDIYHDPANPNFKAAVDINFTGGLNLRDVAATDQYGYAACRSDLTLAKRRWYHRVISLGAASGLSMSSGASLFTSESAPTGVYNVYLRDIVIRRGGEVVYMIYDGSLPATGTLSSIANITGSVVKDGYRRLVTGAGPTAAAGTADSSLANTAFVAQAITAKAPNYAAAISEQACAVTVGDFVVAVPTVGNIVRVRLTAALTGNLNIVLPSSAAVREVRVEDPWGYSSPTISIYGIRSGTDTLNGSSSWVKILAGAGARTICSASNGRWYVGDNYLSAPGPMTIRSEGASVDVSAAGGNNYLHGWNNLDAGSRLIWTGQGFISMVASGTFNFKDSGGNTGTIIFKPPTSSVGLASGTLWNNAGTLAIVP